MLEIGCGKGYWASELIQAGVHVLAQDQISSEQNASTDRGSSFINTIKVSIDTTYSAAYACFRNDW